MLTGIACVAALGTILFYLSHVLWVNPVASEVIKNLIKSSSKKYIIDYEDLQLNTLENEVNVNNIRISYDSTQFAADDSTRLFFDLEMDRLNLAVNSIAEVAYSNSLTVKHAILEAPKIRLYRDPEKKKEKNFEGWLRAYQFISEYLQSLQVNSFSIRNASFYTYELVGNDTVPGFQLDSINASFRYLALDSAAIFNKDIVENIDDFSVEIKNYKRVFPDSLYRIEVESAKVDKQSATLLLSGVKLLPMYEKYDFAQKVGYRKGRVTLDVPAVTFSGIDFHRLVGDRAFASEKLTLDSLSLDIFSDKHMEEYKRYRLMIPEMLQALPFDFRIDTIRVTQGKLKYEERPEQAEADDTGGVIFSDMYATLYNTTNIVSEEEESVMQADIQTTFMHEAKFNVNFRFPLYREDLYHTIQGTLTAMPLTKLNDILEPAVNTSVKSGQLNQLEFTMELDQQKATGMMRFAYDDLKIELLGDQEDPKMKEKIGSFLANLVVIKSDNPSGNQSLREGPIAFERIQEKAVFGYWVRALLTGVQVSVGIDKVPKRLASRKNRKKKDRLSE